MIKPNRVVILVFDSEMFGAASSGGAINSFEAMTSTELPQNWVRTPRGGDLILFGYHETI
jgi:hypothetical protein